MSDDDGDGEAGDGPTGEEREPRAVREGGRGGSGFDPTPYLRQLRGRGGGKAQEYLDVKWRLLWLRREHPNAEITTEHVRLDESSAIFRATVILPAGGSATGYGSETVGDFPDFIEKAETKAIGRALNALGYGAQFTEAEEEGASATTAPARTSSAPTPTSTPTSTVTSPPPARSGPVATPRQDPAPIPAPDPAATQRSSGRGAERPPSTMATSPRAAPRRDAPIDIDQRRERASASAATPPPAPSNPPADAAASAEPDMADFSWTAFWQWARPLGFSNKPELEATIGRSIDGLTPADVRALIRTVRGEP